MCDSVKVTLKFITCFCVRSILGKWLMLKLYRKTTWCSHVYLRADEMRLHLSFQVQVKQTKATVTTIRLSYAARTGMTNKNFNRNFWK